MQIFDDSFKDIFSSQLISIFWGLAAGIILAIYTNEILLIPGMLILLPGFLEMRGNISGAAASRISSGMFLGIIKPDAFSSPTVRGNIIASFILAIIISLFLGIVAFAFTLFVFGVFETKIIFIALIAGIIANTVEIAITVTATFYLFKKGHDPNNIMGPFITSTGDLTSIIALLIALVII
ncbi:MAG: magnesium transporter [archaeon]|nr:magnesium transporter [archaeon]